MILLHEIEATVQQLLADPIELFANLSTKEEKKEESSSDRVASQEKRSVPAPRRAADINGRTYDPIFRNLVVSEVRQYCLQDDLGQIQQMQSAGRLLNVEHVWSLVVVRFSTVVASRLFHNVVGDPSHSVR